MHDLAWMVRDSASAWLRGYGDERFDAYEKFYREALTAPGERRELETINEEYSQWATDRPSPLVRLLNRPATGRALVGLFTVWAAAQAVPHAARLAPRSTAVLLVVAFVGLRIFHRKRRKLA